jgi:tetratricopeptide (TPR) repeat protein
MTRRQPAQGTSSRSSRRGVDVGTSRSGARSTWLWHASAVVLVVLLVAVAYANSLHGEFHLDDQNITSDSSLHLRDLSVDALAEAVWNRRPVASLTFALNYYWGEHDVVGYHVVNVVIHAATALALYTFLLLLFQLPRAPDTVRRLREPLAMGATLLWAANPVQTQAVTYIVQRMTSLAAFFCLLALIAYLKGRQGAGHGRILWWLGAGACGVFAIGSKEIAATLPFALLLIEWCLFEVDRRTARRVIITTALLLIPVIVVAVLTVRDPTGASFWTQLTTHRSTIQIFTVTEHLLTEGRVIVHYITLLVWPHPSRLIFDYDFSISRGMFDPPTTALSWFVVLSTIAGGFALRRRAPLAAFAVLWFFLQLAIESSFIPLDLVFEHRLYLPSMGPAILAALACAWAWQRWERSRLRFAPVVATALIVVVWAGWTIQRNRVWATELSLWTDTVAKAPKNPRAMSSLAVAYRDLGELDRAVELLQTATRDNPGFHHGFGQLGVALLDRGDLEPALEAFQRAHELDPKDAQDTYHLGVVYQKLGRLADAERAYKDTIRLKPEDAEAHNNLGAVYQETGRWDDALMEYQAAARLDPDLPQAHYGMGRVYEHHGKSEDAIRAYRETIQHNPKHVDAHIALAGLYVKLGDKAAAAETFQAALRLAPDVPEGHYQVARLLDELGRAGEALPHYRRFLELASPAQANARAWVETRIRAIGAAESR